MVLFDKSEEPLEVFVALALISHLVEAASHIIYHLVIIRLLQQSKLVLLKCLLTISQRLVVVPKLTMHL